MRAGTASLFQSVSQERRSTFSLSAFFTIEFSHHDPPMIVLTPVTERSR